MEDKKETKKLNIYEKLSNVQNTLKAPKGQYNNFGRYKYRSCEDILEALKPILKENKLSLVITDTLENIGNRYYVKATATIYDLESELIISNSSYAREEEEKKGMDGSQITGTASSYARKYSLNGLFNIDDTKDADTDEYATTTTKEAKKSVTQNDEKETLMLMVELKKLISTGKLDVEVLKEKYNVKSSAEMTLEQLKEAIASVGGEK